jgi:AcrR family transcriptional regulator
VRRLTRRESHAETRNKLISAAREEIANKGVTAASVRSISEAAGYSQGAFYSCFDGKEALLLHLLCELYESILSRFAAVPRRLEDKLRNTNPDPIVDVVIGEMEVFFVSTDPSIPYSRFAIELLMHVNHKSQYMKHYERERAAFHVAIGQVMSRVFDYLPKRPAADPAQLAISLLAAGVGFQTMGAAISIDTRGRLLSTLFRGAIGLTDATRATGRSHST